MIRILGIDPGTAIVGWAVVAYDEHAHTTHAVAYGHIATKAHTPTATRLKDIHADITSVITTYAPKEAAVEELFYFKNAKTVIGVAQARGVLLHACATHNLATAEYTPLQVKQALTGYGRATKKQIQTATAHMLQLHHTPQLDDTADALAIALCHIQSRRFRSIINSQPL